LEWRPWFVLTLNCWVWQNQSCRLTPLVQCSHWILFILGTLVSPFCNGFPSNIMQKQSACCSRKKKRNHEISINPRFMASHQIAESKGGSGTCAMKWCIPNLHHQMSSSFQMLITRTAFVIMRPASLA
jgi:hypothetical protein